MISCAAFKKKDGSSRAREWLWPPRRTFEETVNLWIPGAVIRTKVYLCLRSFVDLLPWNNAYPTSVFISDWPIFEWNLDKRLIFLRANDLRIPDISFSPCLSILSIQFCLFSTFEKTSSESRDWFMRTNLISYLHLFFQYHFIIFNFIRSLT